MTKETKQEFTLRITQANSTQLVVILYEMTLCYLQEAKEACMAKEQAAFHEAARKVRGCLNELMYSLHMEYQLAGNLLQLYLYCIRRLAYSEVRKDAKPLAEIEMIISRLHDAYEKIADQNKQGPVMSNSQEVYAGLTYGRNSLSQNMADQGANRGFWV